MKIKNHSHTIGILSFLLLTAYNYHSGSSENQTIGVRIRSGRINQSPCSFTRIVIGLVILPLLASPKVSRFISDGVVQSDARRCVKVDHKLKLCTSDYEFDLGTSGNQSFVYQPSLIAVTHSVVHVSNSLVSNNDLVFRRHNQKIIKIKLHLISLA